MLIGSLENKYCDYQQFMLDNETVINSLIVQVQKSLTNDKDYQSMDTDQKRERVAIMVCFLLVNNEEEYHGQPIYYEDDQMDKVCAFSGYVLAEIYFRSLEAKGVVTQQADKSWKQTPLGEQLGKQIKAQK